MSRSLARALVAVAIGACGSDGGAADDATIVASIDYEITPTEIALGDVTCGSKKDAAITITNRGEAVLSYAVTLPDGSPFALEAAATGTLAAGASAAIPIDLVPGAAGDVEDSAVIDINGIVQSVPLRARTIGPSLVADPPRVDFGEVRFDRTFTKELTLRNTGNAPALVELFDGAADAMTAGPNGVEIAPLGTATFSVTIGAGAVTGTPARTKLTPKIAASTPPCGALPTVDVSAVRVNTDVTLSVADFGPQACGTGGAPPQPVTITNYSLEDLTYAATLPAGSVFTIASGQSGSVAAASPTTSTTAAVSIGLGATGTVLGVHEESLGVQIDPLPPPSGGARTTTIRLDVRGAVVDVMPTSASFTADDKHADSEKLRFTNDGNELVRLAYAIEGQNASAWSTDTKEQDIPSGESRELTVFFKALKGGPDRYDATLNVTRKSGAQVCSPLPQPKLQGKKK